MIPQQTLSNNIIQMTPTKTTVLHDLLVWHVHNKIQKYHTVHMQRLKMSNKVQNCIKKTFCNN